MSSEVRTFTVTIPKGTPKAAPQLTHLPMPPRTITQIRVRVPPGPLGVVGFQVGQAKVQVIPNTTGQWLVTDNQTVPFKTEGYVTSGTWWFIAYNVGTFTHTLQVTFDCTLVGQPSSTVGTLPGTVISTSNPQQGTTTIGGTLPGSGVTPGTGGAPSGGGEPTTGGTPTVTLGSPTPTVLDTRTVLPTGTLAPTTGTTLRTEPTSTGPVTIAPPTTTGTPTAPVVTKPKEPPHLPEPPKV
jgi:hypothetical protein